MLRITKIGKNNISDSLLRIHNELGKLPAKGLIKFKDLTPIDKGNARRRTTLHKDTIEANYPYAVRLNEGWSKQAPRGMELPFMSWLSEQVRKIIRKK